MQINDYLERGGRASPFPQCRMLWRGQNALFGIVVVRVDVVTDCHDQFLDVAEDASPQPVLLKCFVVGLHDSRLLAAADGRDINY
jgi:hypothetical protein